MSCVGRRDEGGPIPHRQKEEEVRSRETLSSENGEASVGGDRLADRRRLASEDTPGDSANEDGPSKAQSREANLAQRALTSRRAVEHDSAT